MPDRDDSTTIAGMNPSRLAYLGSITFAEFSTAVSDILQEDTDWDKAYDYASKGSTESPEYRWAAFFTAGTTARRITYRVLGRAANVGTEEDVRFLKELFSGDKEAENGIRDALYLLSSFNYAEEPIDVSWNWYSSSECSALRYQGAIMTFFFMVVSKVKDIGRFSDASEQELWQGLVAGA